MSAVMRHGNMGHVPSSRSNSSSEAAAAAAGVGASGAPGTHSRAINTNIKKNGTVVKLT